MTMAATTAVRPTLVTTQAGGPMIRATLHSVHSRAAPGQHLHRQKRSRGACRVRAGQDESKVAARDVRSCGAGCPRFPGSPRRQQTSLRTCQSGFCGRLWRRQPGGRGAARPRLAPAGCLSGGTCAAITQHPPSPVLLPLHLPL
jgi:hypothetical protein